MLHIIRGNDQEFQEFLLQHVQKQLHYSTVLSFDELSAIQSSVVFVLEHAQEGDSVAARFIDGKAQIKQKIKKTQELYQTIMQEYQSFQIDSMKETLESINSFFADYDMDFAANQEGKVWIDYQLANPVDSSEKFGVDYIYEYLKRFYQEMIFIKNLPEHSVLALLASYQQQLGFDYTKDINNLFEVVFNQAVSKIFINEGRPTALLLTVHEGEYLYANQSLLPQHPAVHQLVKENPYYQLSLNKFCLKLSRISGSKAVSNFLLCERNMEKKIIQLVSPVSTGTYASLVEELVSQSEEGCQLIGEKVESPYDLLDLIESEVIARADYVKLFKQLPFPLFAGFLLLLKQQNDPHADSLNKFTASLSLTPLSQAVKMRIEKMTTNEINQLDDLLAEYQLPEPDFS